VLNEEEMKLHTRLISIGFTLALLSFAIFPLSATVLPNVTPGQSTTQTSTVGLPTSYVPQPGTVSSPTFNAPVSTPGFTPSSLPTENEYAPSAPLMPESATFQVTPLFEPAPVMPSNSPVSLLYTGPQDAPTGSGGFPILLNSNTPSSPANDIFTSDPPSTPEITTNFNNSPLQFGPAFAVPEPRLASFVVMAALIAMGVVVMRRRKREAESSSQA
jgi:hypothetical protein